MSGTAELIFLNERVRESGENSSASALQLIYMEPVAFPVVAPITE
jgi:hypothetical protein